MTLERKNLWGLLALVVFISLLPWVLGNAYFISVAVLVGVNSILVLGLNLLLGQAGLVSLGHAAFFGIGAYASGILTAKLSFPAWPAMLVSLLLVGIIALFLGLASLRLKSLYLALTTLAFGEIIFLLLNEGGSLTGGPAGLPGVPRLSFFGIPLNNEWRYFYLVWSVSLALFALSLNISASRVGRALRALRDDETAASAGAVDPFWYKMQVFVLSALYAGLAGSLYAHFTGFLSPGTFSVWTGIQLLTMVAVGGMFTLWGAFLGAALLTSLPEFLRFFQDYDALIYGAALILVMMFMPRGLAHGLMSSLRYFSWRFKQL